MSAHRAVRTRRHAFRRTFTAAALAATAGLGFIAAAGPAQAATTWFVKPALSGGNNAAACTSSATACATVTGVLAKAGFANGDVINVAAGTYIDRPVFTTKGATVNGAGAGSTIITNNNQANTSTLAVTGAVTVNLNDLQLTGGNNSQANVWGGGLRIGVLAGNVAATVNATNVTITGNKSVVGAGVLTYGSTTFTATNSTISSNASSGTNSAGGGIYALGTTTLSGGSVTGNTAPLGGGIVNGGNLTVTNTTISNNTGSTQGGGLYNNGPAQLTGATISGNSSPLGAGLYNAGNTATFGTAAANSGGTLQNNNATNAGGGVWVAAGAVNLNNAVVQNNTATNGGAAAGSAATLNLTGTTASGNTSVLGGALYNTGTTTLNSSTLSGNTGLQGGAAYSTGTLNLSGSTVSGNNTTGAVGSQQAGGIVASGPTTLTNSTVSNNTTANQGGGIVTSGQLTMTGTNVTGNTAVLGGGMVTAGTSSIIGGSVSNNTAVNGGALYNTGTATFDGTQLNGNTANGGSTTNGGNAGAIYNANAVTLHQTTMSGNKAVANTNATPGITGYGGGVLEVTFSASVTPMLTLQNANISGGGVSGGNAVIGGGIAVYPNTITGGTTGRIVSTGSLLSQNVAAAGGGVYTPGQLTMTGSTVEGNKATHASAGNGAGIYAGTSPVVLDSTHLSNNEATVAGGGLFVVAGSTTELKNGSTVGGNKAVSGAGILNASTLTMTDATVNANSASYAGGGLYSSGVSNLTNVNFDSNSAAAFGGSILTATGALSMTKGQVDNSDAFAGGGVIVGANSPASFDGVRFSDNTSTGASSGGGALLSAGNVTVRNSTFLHNTADGSSGYGGAIFSGSQDDNVNTSLQVDTSLFTGNSAYGAAAIVAGSNGTGSTNKTSINNSTITGNDSASAIGALQLYQGTSISVSTITDNTAGGAANQNVGGIVAAAGVVGLSGSILSGNTGHQCYQAVADGGYNLLDPNDATCGLSAAKHDVFAAPQLAALAENGGPSQTRLPSASSPALDQVPASTATGVSDAISGSAITLCGSGAVDQRGTSRPQGARCDIGAVEKAQVAPTVDGPANADYAVGSAGIPLTYTTTGSPQSALAATGLPSGVTFHDNGDGTGTLSGTPAANSGGSYTVTITATNEAGSDSTDLALVVHQAPLISGPATATYTVGQPGGPSTFTQTSGFPLGNFTSTGALPGGVTFDGTHPGSGSYAGTPAAGSGGVYNLTVTDSNGTPPDATAPFTLTVDEAPSIDGPGTATFKVGTAGASDEFTATGFPVPTFAGSGLPGGLSVTSTGSGKAKITGTAANGTGGQYGVDVTATNGVGSPATKHLDVTVDEAPELTGPATARFVVGVATAVGFSSDGYPQANLVAIGALPATLHFHDNGNGSATLSGTVTTADIGTYTITVKASNGVDPDATQQVTVEVVPPLSISTTSLPNAAYKTTYSGQVAASGGQPPYTFTVSAGSLPAGLTMNSAGLITGATTANPGTYTFTVKATDALHPAQSATKQLSITVVKGVTVLKTAPILLTIAPNGDITLNIALLEADLKGGFPLQPIAAAPVTFKSGTSTVCTANTDVNGHVKCQPSLLNSLIVPLKGTVTATYPGNTTWLPSTSSAGLIGP
jgi:hypothetical protein